MEDSDDSLNLDRGALLHSDDSEIEFPFHIANYDEDEDSDESHDEVIGDPPDQDPPDPSNQSRHSQRWPLALLSDGDDDGPSALLSDGDEDDRPQRDPDIDITELIPGDEADDINPANSGFLPDHIPTELESGLLAGRSYPTWAAFDHALDEYEAKAGWRFKRLKRNKQRLIAQCRGGDPNNPDACKAKFTVRFGKKSGNISVRSSYLVHTCPQGIHQFRHGSHKARWVEGKVEPTLRANLESSNKTLRGTLREMESADSTVWTVQRARAKVVKDIGGDQKSSFHTIPSYVEKVRRSDPGTHIEYETYCSDDRFRRMYCSPASSQHAFQFVRPFVGLDATHSGGEFPMIILLATTFDCNNHILLLAWAVVGNETRKNWEWFCKHLAESFPRIRACRECVIISDRDKGLLEAVEGEWGAIFHSFCTRHLRANVITNSDKTLGDFFFDKLCRQVRESDFVKLLEDYCPLSQRQQEGLAYIRAIDPKVYARYAFPTPRWGHTTSNVVEILNGAIRPFRKKPALLICKSLWDYTMKNHFERLQAAKKWPSGEGALTQHAQSMLNILYNKASGVEERPSSETSSLMCDSKGEWAINMALQICECKEWQEMGFPCVHAVKFCGNRQEDEKKYIHSIWMAANQVQAYGRPLAPISFDGLVIDKDYPCREPLIVPSKSKTTKSNKRKASRFERAIAGERLAAKQHQQCSICHKEGHNKRSCPIRVQRTEVAMLKDADYLRVCAIHTMSRDDIGQRWTFWNTRPEPKLSFSQWHEQMYPLTQ